MLNDFIASHRQELIERTRSKVALRGAPNVSDDELANGVPLFLTQLGHVFARETAHVAPDGSVMGTEASALGSELLGKGYSIAQVVHNYGDICQAVTELAGENASLISVDNFHTFNRFLDNAIAGAVTSFGESQRTSANDAAQDLKIQVEIACTTFEALKAGNVGVRGATGSLLGKTLLRLRALATH